MSHHYEEGTSRFSRPEHIPSMYPRWSQGEMIAIQYAAKDLVENFSKTDYQHRLAILYDLMTLHDS